MIAFAFSRLVRSLVMLGLVSLLTFVLTAFAPGDPATTILGSSATPDQVAKLNSELGLDQPIWEQYVHWLMRAVTGDFGHSLVTSQSVSEAVSSGLPVTLALVIGGTLFAASIGIVLGTVSAIRAGWLGRVVDVLATVGLALPNFWLGWILVAVFAVNLRVLPATGYVPLDQSPPEWLRSLILPVVTLAAVGVTGIAKQTRDSMRETLSREFIKAWLADGIPRRRVVLRHGLRNAAIPVVTVIGLYFIGMLSGTVIVESVFAMPGLGGMSVSAARSGDLPMIQGVVVTLCIGVVIVNLVLDLAYAWLNPKERAG